MLGPAGGVAYDEHVKKMSVKTTASMAKISDVVGAGEGSVAEGAEPAVKRDSDAYQEARTYVFLEMELHKPLIAKRPASVLTERSARSKGRDHRLVPVKADILNSRVKEYVPVRSALPRREGGVEWAVNDFQQQTASIASQLVSEFHTLLEEGELDPPRDGGDGTGRAGVRDGSSMPKTEAEERSEYSFDGWCCIMNFC